jgi:transcriptional regulator with XRE-family HTH domain
VSYQDELNELEEEIRQELRRQETTSPGQPRQFSNPSELLSFLRSTSVRKTIKTLTFSACVRRLRTRVGASKEDLAAALEIPTDALEQLESNESVPWIQPPSVIVNVAYAFRLHINAIENLTRNSFTIASVTGRISDSDLASQSVSSWLAEVRQKLETRGDDDLVD